MTASRTARVLIVDDSVTMRAFFGAVFERAKGIEVVGTAASAEEARRMMIHLRPNVVTLDIEMPGMSGLDFLDEIMRDRPTPVIMLSSLTQKGAEASFQAIERGAIDCFPKPSSANREDFATKLRALVIAAANGNVRVARYAKDLPPPIRQTHQQAPFDWNGKIVTMCASTGGVDALLQLLPAFPANCPPMVIALRIEPDLLPPLLQRLKTRCSAKVVAAEDGQPLHRGTIQIVSETATHAVIAWIGKAIAGTPSRGARLPTL